MKNGVDLKNQDGLQEKSEQEQSAEYYAYTQTTGDAEHASSHRRRAMGAKGYLAVSVAVFLIACAIGGAYWLFTEGINWILSLFS